MSFCFSVVDWEESVANFQLLAVSFESAFLDWRSPENLGLVLHYALQNRLQY